MRWKPAQLTIKQRSAHYAHRDLHPHHVLPTSGTARFFSPLNVDDFVKKSSLICCSRAELERVADQVILLAQQEGLDAHANSVAIRFGKEIRG